MSLPGSEHAGGVEVVRFVRTLASASTLGQLEQRFLAGFGGLLGVPMYGYALLDSRGSLTCRVCGNVSPTFVARYERTGRDVDPLLAHAYVTGRPTYNRTIMSAQEWEESDVYRRAYGTHAMRHVVEVPVWNDRKIIGVLHFASTDHEWDLSGRQIELADALGGVLAVAITAIESRVRMRQELDQALAVLELAGTPFAVSDPACTELLLNDAARRMLADVVEPDACLHRLLARSAASGGISRRIDVVLTTGEVGVLHGHVSPGKSGERAAVAVLELEREQPTIAPSLLAPLTPREQEIALLVVEGLADREIAERLYLSHHTISQYVKRIYRKLDVDSRVGLTRMLLRPSRRVRRS